MSLVISLGAQLGIPGLGLILLDMDGGEHILLHHALVEQHGVLVVVALPGHEAHEDVPAQGDLAPVGGGAVGQYVLIVYPLACIDNGPLVDAGGVVGAQIFGQAVLLGLAAVISYSDIPGGHLGDHAGSLRQDGHLGVDAVLMLLAGSHDGCLGPEQGHSLALHVGAHQGAVGVVILEEGDHGGSHGDHHLGDTST